MAGSYTYDIRNWEQQEQPGGGILLCPGPKVLHKRFVVFAIALAALVPLWMLYSAAPDIAQGWTLRQALTQDGQTLDDARLTVTIRQLLVLVMLCVVSLGALAPVSCLWNCLRIEKTPRGDLAVFRRGILLPSTREWPVAEFDRITPGIKEVTRSTRYGRYQVWWFSVNLMSAMRGGSRLEFLLIEQREPALLYFPQPLQQFAATLERLTGITAAGFDVRVPDVTAGSGRVQVVRGAPQTTRRVYNSLEEAPPELRARFEQLKAEAERTGRDSIASETVTITENGQTRTYHSVDEMPPAVRARFEQIKRAARGDSPPPGLAVETESISVETTDNWEM